MKFSAGRRDNHGQLALATTRVARSRCPGNDNARRACGRLADSRGGRALALPNPTQNITFPFSFPQHVPLCFSTKHCFVSHVKFSKVTPAISTRVNPQS